MKTLHEPNLRTRLRLPRRIALAGVTLTIACSTVAREEPISYPPTPRSEAVDLVEGHRLENPYAWLEDLSSPEVWTWAAAQSSVTQSYWAAEGSAATRLVTRLKSLGAAQNVNTPVRRGDRFFFMVEGAESEPPALYQSRGNSSQADRLLARPDDLVEAGMGASQIVDFRVSPSAAFVLVVVRETRTGRRIGRVLDTDGDPHLRPVIDEPWLGLEPWRGDETAIYFAGREGGRGPGVWRYDLATEQIDRLALPDTADEVSRYEVSVSHHLGGLVILEHRLSGGSRASFMPLQSGRPNEVVSLRNSTSRLDYLGSLGDAAYFLVEEKERVVATRYVDHHFKEFLALDLAGRDASSVQLFGGRYLLTTSGERGPRVEILDLDGEHLETLRPPYGLLWTNFPPEWPAIVGGATHRYAYMNSISLHRPGIYEIDTENLELTPWRLRDLSTAEGSGAIVVDRHLYPSSDGQDIPVSLVHKKDTGPGDGAPVLLWVYGAHGFVATPFFNAFFRTFIEAGGILVMPQIRGGGVHGRRWHAAGSRANKKNTVLDAVAAIDWLESFGVAAPGRLAVMGNSAGSVPAFAAALARIDLVSALILEVPLCDLVRHAQWSGGWASEFGLPDVPRELATLLEISPYEAVGNHRELPATLILAGENDTIAPPHHAFKLAAAMQHAQTKTAPILLHLVEGAGHQIGVDARQRLESQALELAFLSRVLGLE